jgi:hypothetical protein
MSPRRHFDGATKGPVEVDDEGQTMTVWRVERTSRAAFPMPSGASIGDCSLMPPPSQGAERRTERRARPAGSRWGLRALVIGGLAGAAWLLTGTAAHAADHDAAAAGPSLLGSVVSGDIAEPTVSTVLQAAAQPLESDRPAHRHHDAVSLLPVPVRALARPAGTLTSTLSEATPARSTGATGSSVVRVIRGITGPLRLTGGPADSPLAPVTAPLVRTLHPVTGLLPHATQPAVTTPRPLAAPAAHGARSLRPVAVPAASRVNRVGSAVQTGLAPNTVATADLSSVRQAAAPARTATRPHPASRTAAGPETLRETPYDGDGPAPLQVHLGAVSGLLNSGSGGSTEGGSAAFLPAAVAASSMAFHRLALPGHVEVRRYDAEAPTVSPD